MLHLEYENQTGLGFLIARSQERAKRRLETADNRLLQRYIAYTNWKLEQYNPLVRPFAQFCFMFTHEYQMYLIAGEILEERARKTAEQ